MQIPAESLSATSVRDKVVTATEAVRLIRDGDSVVVEGFVGQGFAEELDARVGGAFPTDRHAQRPHARVALLITCFNDTLFPQTGRAAVRRFCTAADNSCLMHIRGALRRHRAGVRVTYLAEILAAT